MGTSESAGQLNSGFIPDGMKLTMALGTLDAATFEGTAFNRAYRSVEATCLCPSNFKTE